VSRVPSLLMIEQLDLFTREAPPPPSRQIVPQLQSSRHRPKGQVYDLERFFTVINQTAFKNELAPCVLRWSRNRWQITLGLCDVKSRTIAMNRALDDARVPEMVIASIMHHEMLHLYLGISEGPKGTQRYHTPQFRAAERIFPGHAESERWIADRWPLRGRPAVRPRPAEESFLSYLALMYP
jgi:hypothetical protein